MQAELPPTKAIQRLADVMSARRYEATAFEMDCWVAIIERVPERQFLAFLSHHYQTSPYAPQPSDATKFLDVAASPDAAFLILHQAVRTVGPYVVPNITEPVLVEAIHLFGGWASVNELMPAPSESFQMRSFRERFDACFNAAIAHVRINAVPLSGPLHALHHATPSPTLAIERASRES